MLSSRELIHLESSEFSRNSIDFPPEPCFFQRSHRFQPRKIAWCPILPGEIPCRFPFFPGPSPPGILRSGSLFLRRVRFWVIREVKGQEACQLVTVGQNAGIAALLTQGISHLISPERKFITVLNLGKETSGIVGHHWPDNLQLYVKGKQRRQEYGRPRKGSALSLPSRDHLPRQNKGCRIHGYRPVGP